MRHAVVGALAAVVVWSGGAAAQIAVSEEQQCVWSCLHGVAGGDNTDPAYGQCIADRCGGDVMPPIGSSWSLREVDPDGRYAVNPAHDADLSLAYLCTPAGESLIQVSGPPVGTRPRGTVVALTLIVDGQSFGIEPASTGTVFRQPMPAEAVLLEALMNGQEAVLTDNRGERLGGVWLAGADHALGEAIAYCAGAASAPADPDEGMAPDPAEGRPDPGPTPGALSRGDWQSNPLAPEYLDGRAAVTSTNSSRLRLVYECGRDGTSRITFGGIDFLRAVPDIEGPAVALLIFDRSVALPLDLVKSETGHAADLAMDGQVISALRSHNRAELVVAPNEAPIGTFSLRGSSAMLEATTSYCSGG